MGNLFAIVQQVGVEFFVKIEEFLVSITTLAQPGLSVNPMQMELAATASLVELANIVINVSDLLRSSLILFTALNP